MESRFLEECLLALSSHHKARTQHANHLIHVNNTLQLSAPEQQGEPLLNIELTGAEIARRFAHAAADSLEEEQQDHLLRFLQEPHESLSSTVRNKLHDGVLGRLNEFHEAELRELGACRSRLAKLSGPVDADLGIILHCQTKKGEVGYFWDHESPTIQTLTKKGFSDQFAFCYDWHWRAEESIRDRGVCPTIGWKKSVRKLHDDFSVCLLSMVNFRFLIVGGSCARSHYRNVPSKKRQELLIPLVPDLELKHDLEFGDQSLKRIVAYLDHPSSIYFNNTIGFTAPSLQLDAGSNLFLWLLGRPHDPVAFQSFFDEQGFRRPRAAPLSDMWSYLRREKALGRTL